VGIVYLMCIAVAMWSRYAYLIEVSRVMTHGRNFDPVTSMPSYEAGQPMAEPFTGVEGRACGIIVVSISNLTMLEELHGRAAYNHALFVCASRLRRMALPGAELVRLREDAFVLVMRVPRDAAQVVDCARNVMQRLSRPVTLGMSREITALEESRATWEPSLGIGVLLDEPGADPSLTVAGARAVSRTAWSYPSRMAWFDEAAGTVNELPAAG
jgi:GGDEF domain-containing protein